MEPQIDIGMVGLGVMGRNLVLNMADHGFTVAGYDKDPGGIQRLRAEAQGRKVQGAASIEEFVGLLRVPRAVMMLVPAGPPVDAVIREVLPLLSLGDILIDGGNSYYKDTALRAKAVGARGVHFLGVGISGGEYGARHGPSIMPGGPKEAYERVRPIFEAVAAKVETGATGSAEQTGSQGDGKRANGGTNSGAGGEAGGEPCVAYLGPGSAGHYVKMVHNGIEYGIMRLIAETYDLMRRGLNLSDDELSDVYAQWNRGELSSYLLEITADIFRTRDERTGARLIDVILDEAKQLGTGRWTSQESMDLGVPAPTIDAAVAMRNLSALRAERQVASQRLSGPRPEAGSRPGGTPPEPPGGRDAFVARLRGALYVGMVSTFAQGMALLRAGSRAHNFGLDLAQVAGIWRGGCIIRAALLEAIRRAYRAEPDLPNLLIDPDLSREVTGRQADLRAVVCAAAEWGIAAPALSVSLGYFDSYRSAWMPANLIQAQRDFFGAHTYERVDEKGVFHTEWEAEVSSGADATAVGGSH